MNSKITQYIDALQQCMDITTFKKILLQISRTYDFEYVIYNIQITSPFDKTRYFAIGNYPSRWLEAYESNNYALIDPIIQHCISSENAIVWHDSYSHNSNVKVKNFFEHAKLFHLYDGFSKSLIINKDEIGILSLATKKILSDKVIMAINAVMNTLQSNIHNAMIRVSKDDFNIITPILTPREHEVLFHLAKGETSAEAAKVLNISETTVIFHMKNIIQKVDAKNRTHAIIKCVSLDLIDLSKFKNKENAYNW